MPASFRPLQYLDGHLPIEDHGLVGDGRGAALIGRDGTVWWLCAPRFDSPAAFCGLLDPERGGLFRVAPTGLRDSRQRYLDDTGVLVTELRTDTGLLEITDGFTLRAGEDLATSITAGEGELLRRLTVTEGEVTVAVTVAPRGDVTVSRAGDGWQLASSAFPETPLHLTATRALTGTYTELRLRAGETVWASLAWADDTHRQSWPEPAERLAATIADWRRWAGCVTYSGLQEPLVRRSAITLKLLDNARNGAIVAAPTSSLPEEIGGTRNWDYRYVWIRDAAFSVYALRRVGMAVEGDRFLSWVLAAIDRDGEPKVLYDLDGHQPPSEYSDPELAGYRGSAPVRWGNGAADQTQHDVYGEVLDCAYQWVRGGGKLDQQQWQWLSRLAESARTKWREPDHGIWEIRSPGRRFTYSVAMCQVALDRAARLATELDLPGDAAGWAADAGKLREELLRRAWNPELAAITEQFAEDGDAQPPVGLDASVLTLPLRRVIPADHPKMVTTTRAVAERLGAGDGLVYRYLPEDSPDGLPGHEGAFLLCSFWLVDNLAKQGRVDEAGALYESLCARANPLGLLSEEIDPSSGAFLGNFPQAFSHVGVISSGLNLARATGSAGEQNGDRK